MKVIVIFLTVLLFFPFPARGDEYFQPWTGEEVSLQAVALALKSVDWLQTRYIATHPENHYEINPILGRHPSLRDVDMYFAATAVAQVGISHALPHKWRKYWIYTQLAICGSLVLYNQSVGIGLEF